MSEHQVTFLNLNESSSKDINIFHRTGRNNMTPTDMEAHVEKAKSGFVPGSGDMYGKGLYGADWDTQVKGSDNMLHYGPIILHYVAKAKGYMVFDYRLAKRLFGSRYSLEDQLVAAGAYSMANMPTFISVLSEDLEDTLKYPRISADRAYWFTKWFYNGRDLKKEMSSLKYEPVFSLKQAYATSFATMNRNVFNGKIGSGIIKGIAFAGNHDGNVIVTYPPAFKKLIFVGWCCAEKGKITKPWDYDGGNTTADGINGQYQDKIGTLLVNTTNKSVVEIKWFTNLNQNTVDNAAKLTLKSLEWLARPLARYKDLNIEVNDKGETTIKSGKWIFGKCCASKFEGDFIGGEFLGDTFDGKFLGGTFCKGEFTGTFSGGIYIIDKNTKWSNSARSEKNKHKSISVAGKVYPWDVLDNPDKEWKRIQSLQKSRATGSAEEIDNLAEFIQTKVGYDCSIVIDPKWETNLTNEQKFDKFKQKFPWLFNIRRLTGDPNIYVESNGSIVLTKGELIVGTLRFDKYMNKVTVRGGQIMGQNIFEGEFYGGIYDEGKFEGVFHGGIFNLDKAAWMSKAKVKVPLKFDNKLVFAAIYKKKLYKIPEEVLAFDNKKYQNFAEILKVLSANKWADLVIESKKDYLKNGKKKRINRSDDDQLELNAEEQNVPDWAEEAEGVNVSGLYIPESVEGDSMIDIIYENYINKEDVTEPITLFGESFGYWTNRNFLNEKINENEPSILEGLNEKEFSISNLSDPELDKLYQEFQNSYTKATGAAFSQSAFFSRADNWTFLGNPPDEKNPNALVGGVGIRKQPSGLIKLVSSFGDMRSIFKGFEELKQKYGRQCIWGFVTNEIKRLIIKRDKDFVTLPGIAVKAMEGMIKKLSNGEVKSVGLDGSISVDTPAGVMKKYFIANKTYVRWLLDSVEDPANAGRIPISQTALTPLIAVIKALL